jgi:hypothetical protein
MDFPEYMRDIVRNMQQRSAAIRRDFKAHNLSAGENRENVLQEFLIDHLPQRFGISSGLVISHDGLFSNQADLLIVDKQNNAPFYGSSRHKLWPVEAVYALIEIKTSLERDDLADAIAKGRRFKSLPRQFLDIGASQRISESLFVIWSFEAPSTSTFKKTAINDLKDIPNTERPDLIVSLNGLVARAGSYLELSTLGQPNSSHRKELVKQHGHDLTKLLPDITVYNMGENALMSWYIFLDSWLRQAGARYANPLVYLPPDQIFGQKVE